MSLMLLAFAACATGPTASDSADTAADTAEAVTDYVVSSSVDPAPLTAGSESEFTFQIRDQLGRPIPDLQTSHERVEHVQFLSRDLSSFQHLHEEDYTALTADDLRESTFHFPLTVPMAGDYYVVYDFAHHNQYLNRSEWITAVGEPAQAAAADLTPNTTATVDGVTGTLVWDVVPVPGHEADLTVHLEDAAGPLGPTNDPLVQYLGADAHLFVVDSAIDWASHTHAWFPGMEDVAPGHDMPHVYEGPNLPFHMVLPVPGAYKIWVQFARSSDPAHVYVLPFVFEVVG